MTTHLRQAFFLTDSPHQLVPKSAQNSRPKMDSIDYKSLPTQAPKSSPWFLQRLVLAYLSKISLDAHPKKQRLAVGGFSLLESLMAVVVVTVLLVGIAPMIALSTATRVNARRVDQAVQAARTYADAVRSGVITTQYVYNFQASTATGTDSYFFDTIGAPGAAATTNSRGVSVPAGMSVSTLFNSTTFPGVTIDTNGNGFSTTDPQDLVVMPLRNAGAVSSSDLDSQGFVLVLRVYRADAFNSARTGLAPVVNTLRRGDEPECTNAVFSISSPRSCPLAQVRYEVFPSTITYDSLKTRL